MSQVLSIRDGESYSHGELQTLLGLRTERAVKELIGELAIPYFAISGSWWMAGEDIRKAFRHAASTTTQKREAKAEA